MLTVKVGATWTNGTPVGGTWLHQLGPVGGLKFSRSWPLGCKAASWSLALPANFTHPHLTKGSLVEVYDLGLRVWLGVLSEPDRDAWTFTADGIGLQFDRVAAVTGTTAGSDLTTSSTISAVAATAIARGWRFIADASLPSTSLSTLSDNQNQPNSLAALLNESQRRTGQRWAVNEDGRLYMAADPTTPTLMLPPGVPALAVADDDYFSLRFGRYVATVAGSPSAPASWGVTAAPTQVTTPSEDAKRWGPRETIDDLTTYGVLTASQAGTIETALLADGRARPAFTNAVNVDRSQVTTLGGVPVRASLIREGSMVRHFGAIDVDGRNGPGETLDWIVGEVEVDADTPDRVTLTPAGIAERTTEQLTAALTFLALPGFK